MNKLNWGFIGCGDVTEVKSGPAFRKVENSDVVAVMRRNAKLAIDYAKRHNIKKYYSNAEELIHDPDVNAIYVNTPPSTHAEYAIAAMNAGKPVYVEKPMAHTYADCVEMNRVSDKTGIPLRVAYYRRALEGFLKLKEAIEQGEIGEIQSVNIRFYEAIQVDKNNLPWRVIPEIAGGGLFVDLASHTLDYLDYLFGPIQRAHGAAKNLGGMYAAEDTVAMHFEFENGISGTGNWSFNRTEKEKTDVTEIVGSKGVAQFGTFDKKPFRIIKNGKTKFIEYDHPENIQLPLIKSVVKDFAENTQECPSTGISAARTNWVIQEALKGYYSINT